MCGMMHFTPDQVRGMSLAEAFTLDNFRAVFDEPTHVRAIVNTILIGTIGGAIARALHKQGATVTLSGTRAEALEQLIEQASGTRARWSMA